MKENEIKKEKKYHVKKAWNNENQSKVMKKKEERNIEIEENENIEKQTAKRKWKAWK